MVGGEELELMMPRETKSHLAAVQGGGGETWRRVTAPAAAPPPSVFQLTQWQLPALVQPTVFQGCSSTPGQWGGGGCCCCIETIVNDAFDIVPDKKIEETM